ncbi:MAG: methyltransferase domain-containing protein [Myxococcota bacterium]
MSPFPSEVLVVACSAVFGFVPGFLFAWAGWFLGALLEYALFRRCCRVDPSANAIERLRALFEAVPNVEFVVGSATEIPYADETFDIVVVNSVLQMLPDRDAFQTAMRELVRVCRPGGTIFVGELPFQDEHARGVLAHLLRNLVEYGAGRFIRLAYPVYVRPVLRGEPIVTSPATNLHVPADEFEELCRRLGLTVHAARHRQPHRPSATRNDYRLERRGDGSPSRGSAPEDPRVG